MWAQPWAWLGLTGLAVPIAIHLLARHQAARTLFPSLRFIDVAEVLFIRRQRLTDIPLLLVRLTLVAMAVTAFAGPRWPMSGGNATGPMSLAVVVDTSAGALGDAGPAAARAAAQSAASSTIVEAESLPAGITSATAWLARQTGRREMLIVSDFQRGSLDAAAIAAVPAGVGLRFHVLPMFAPKRLDGFELRGERSRMVWPVPPSGVPLPLAVKAGARQARADAMLSAVASLIITAPVDATARRATIVLPSAPEYAPLAASAPPIDHPWMFEVMRPLLNDGATRAHVTPMSVSGELTVLVDDEPDSVLSAGIAASMLGALLQPLPWSEFEPETIAPETLRGWERAPSASPGANAGEAQGRWLWLAVLFLLVLETWMRRQIVTRDEETAHARVA